MKKILRQEEFYSKDLIQHNAYNSTSKGAQPKWIIAKDDKLIYLKQDYHGYESLSEWVVYQILNTCSTIDKSMLVEYTPCYIDGVEGCYSHDFKHEEEEHPMYSIVNILRVDLGKNYTRKSNKDKFQVLIDALKEYTKKDFSNELKLMFAVDAFFLNEDRHLYNFSVLENDNGEFRFAPLFDNGMALLSRTKAYDSQTPTLVNIRKVKPSLLNPDFSKHLELYDSEPFLYKSRIKLFLEEYREELGRIYSIILRQIEEPLYSKLFIKEFSNGRVNVFKSNE